MAAEQKQGSGSGGGLLAALLQLVFVLAIIAAIVMVAGAVVAASEGGRKEIERRLAQRLGCPVRVGGTHVGWPYALVLDRVESAGITNQPLAGFKVDQARVGLAFRGWRPVWDVRVVNAVLNLVRDRDRVWHPEAFGRLGALPGRNLGEVSALSQEFRESACAHAEGATIRWFTEDGTVRSSVEGVTFDLQPVYLPGRWMYDYRLRVSTARTAEGETLNDMGREWLAVGDRHYIEVERMDQSVPVASRAFWEVKERD